METVTKSTLRSSEESAMRRVKFLMEKKRDMERDLVPSFIKFLSEDSEDEEREDFLREVKTV